MNSAWSVIVPIALLPFLFHWMPLWRPNGIWFGVTVAPGYSDGPAARTVLHRFRIAIWLLALAAVTATALVPPAIFAWAFPAAMTLELAGALAVVETDGAHGAVMKAPGHKVQQHAGIQPAAEQHQRGPA